ncbi:MAG: hypothetical protein AUG48_08625 [Actinobacteria bacterium 13_1_20CM_3_68_9]|nr:MAG: hypothetical protein AUG48_08625 [Actinobacteria bacterium 13_1_20CM_3_68_9]
MLLAGLFAIAYLILQPASADLAAQTFRSDLFASHGFLLWNNDWYGGRLVGALAVVTAAGLFGLLARYRHGDRAFLAILWFGAGTATELLSGRITFALGLAIGLGALLALQRGRPLIAGMLAVLTALASPVAALFAALAGVAVFLAGNRRGGAAVAVGAAASIAALSLAFPAGGDEPFTFSAFIPVPLFTLAALLLLPPEERTLRSGVAVYALVSIVAFVVATPVGGNMARLGALAAGPVLALGLVGRRRTVALAVLAVPLLYWQWVAAVRDLSEATGDPSVHSSYYQPLLAQLELRTGGRPVRVEIPPTRNRWEADYVAPRFPLARGWLRQLEYGDIDLFTNGNLTAAAYRSWLDQRGVSYVAVAVAEPDYLAIDEEALIRGGLPYLRPVWSNQYWRLYQSDRRASRLRSVIRSRFWSGSTTRPTGR